MFGEETKTIPFKSKIETRRKKVKTCKVGLNDMISEVKIDKNN
jgi:hypothetical protein